MKKIALVLSCAALLASCSENKSSMEKANELPAGTTVKGADGSKIKKQADGDIKVKDAQGNVTKQDADDGTVKVKKE
ncbi:MULTISPECIES: hypothetical protein [Hymenobacter]|uniref:Lipoprotein n=1 Tax=Hymenobacter jejuensis TaxID=2502781 RepID=A0A5B8A0N5_9BACT|nr:MULTISPECIES: hypothetical protein [Hymenobacter]MBC6991914.1 hypothetical protein [Hymenobacter sp. BT491]QDA60235.1 hypothetical protein FHG12_08975 [Hymenobacter jejuensis]